MIEIIFQDRKDARNFYELVRAKLAFSEKHDQNILHLEDQHIIKMQIESNKQKLLKLVKEVFFHFIVTSKQDDWFRKILADHFYYQDEGEQQQILDITHSILEGNREGLAPFVSDLDVKGNLESVIQQMFQGPISLSFDSFVKFRMGALMKQLTRYIELSIDEYKMEQEYQMFIQTLRQFLDGRPAKLNCIHLLIDDGVHFFNEDFFEIKRTELAGMIDRKLLINHPVYVDSVTIAPLLSIAPASIYLYSDDLEHPLVRTIYNIFEERLVLYAATGFYDSRNMLPFTADEKI